MLPHSHYYGNEPLGICILFSGHAVNNGLNGFIGMHDGVHSLRYVLPDEPA
jgi:hypothetical protein